MPLRKEPSSLRCLAQEAVLLLGETLWKYAFMHGLDTSLLDTPALKRFLNRIQSTADESLTTTLIKRLEASLVVVRHYPRIRSFLSALFPALLNTKVTILDVCLQDAWIQDCTIKCLPLFQNLKKLRIGTREAIALQESLDSVVNSIPCFSCITDLCILGICNRNILSKIASTCRSLRSLDIRYSIAVGDEDTACLTICKSLRTLNFYGTACTSDGITVLLAYLPLLNDIGSCDHLNDVIKSVTIQDSDTHHLNLSRFISNEIPAPFLESICRDIVEIHLSLESIKPVKRLPVFQNLSKLTIDLRLGAASGVNLFKLFLVYLTPCLHELHFNSSLIRKKDVAALSHYAPYLRALELKHLTLDTDEMRSNPRTFFNFLSHLHVVDVPLPLVELLLKSSSALETCYISLHKRSTSLITDDLIASVLSVNALRRLERLCIHADNTLTMLTVRSLLNTCSFLKRIEALNTWSGITTAELDAFRQEIRRNNLALTIDP